MHYNHIEQNIFYIVSVVVRYPDNKARVGGIEFRNLHNKCESL